MIVEGRGRVAPKPIRIRMTAEELQTLRAEAWKRDEFRQYGRRPDAWGRGLSPNGRIVGMVGEWAACRFLQRYGFQVAVDFTLRPGGDGGRDIECCGLIIQVKGRQGTFPDTLVRRVDDKRRIRGFKCDLFVFAQWRDAGAASIDPLLLGWIWAKDARAAAFTRSPVAPHWNLAVADVALLPMRRLIDELRSRAVA